MKIVHIAFGKFSNFLRRADRPKIHQPNHSLASHSTLRIITLCLALAFCCSTFLSSRVVAESTTFTVNNNNTVLELTVPSSISIELNPTSGTDYDTVNLPIGIGTNNQYGYTLSMSISSNTLSRTSDVLDGSGNTITPTPTINSITTSISPSSFASSNDTINTWGYKLATNTNYLPIPTSTTPLRVTTSPSNSTNITTGTGDINLNFAAKVDTTTPAGTYQTTINFTAVTNAVSPILYGTIAAMSKGKNTDENSHFSWTNITTPTTTSPATDTSTSGVFEWDGTDSNGGGNKIYFYRGILDTTTATYGSDGLADAYPNYVRLGDTCWRIVRTTSTGGVKMIYNGSYSGGTTANSCANAQANAQLTTSPFNTNSATVAGTAYTGLQYQNIHAVGYTYTSSVAAGTTTTKTPAQLFGASGNDTTTNNQSSIIKQYIEDWYAANMTSYTSILEGDAGYCQDRRLNTGTTWTTPLAEDSNTIVPYGTSGLTQYYFGAYPRNAQSSTFNPLLTCPRGKVDLYSYSADAGNGNGQLTYPVALLTADEASLAGNGWSNSFSAYNANSFLRSGSFFWLLSPNYRYSSGDAYGFYLSSGGYLNDYGGVLNAVGVRPAISLEPGTTVSSGSGIATDPWVVTAP